MGLPAEPRLGAAGRWPSLSGGAIRAELQHLLSRASYQADRIRDDLRRYVVGYLWVPERCWSSMNRGSEEQAALLGHNANTLAALGRSSIGRGCCVFCAGGRARAWRGGRRRPVRRQSRRIFQVFVRAKTCSTPARTCLLDTAARDPRKHLAVPVPSDSIYRPRILTSARLWYEAVLGRRAAPPVRQVGACVRAPPSCPGLPGHRYRYNSLRQE